MLLVLALSLGRALAQDAVEVGHPPSEEPAQQAAVAPTPPDPAMLVAYKRKHLVRASVQTSATGMIPIAAAGGATTFMPYSTTITTWGVFDGGGAPYPTAEFAKTVGDKKTTRTMAKELAHARRAASIWVPTGSVVTLGGIAYAALNDDSDAKFLAGTVVMLGGTTALTLGAMAPSMAKARQKKVDKYYSPSEADRWIEDYNAKLRDQLGLSAEDVLQIDLQSAAPRVTIQPTLALGWGGLTGTF